MTLAQWAKLWPNKVQQHPTTKQWYTPDSVHTAHRPGAWSLDDYLVSSVCGGSIWFLPRLPKEDTAS